MARRSRTSARISPASRSARSTRSRRAAPSGLRRRREAENLAGLCRCRRTAIVFAADAGNAHNQLGVALGEPCLVEAQIVFETGADMAAELETPAIDLELMPANAGRRPCRIRHDGLELGEQELKHLAARRQRVGNAEH